ncbi:MAG: DUF4062 domain-containing protein [Planctomycetota bacterium]|nr:MAG: DUF4062 domain-containing protein [Planctomycetota bacterium]
MFQWHTAKVFLSSTFKDMELTRDQLARKVFSPIRESLKERSSVLIPMTFAGSSNTMPRVWSSGAWRWWMNASILSAF